jgi:phosphatidylserine/phosphatidylglycerophosphate/cardiolipin synthase-like enzyme
MPISRLVFPAVALALAAAVSPAYAQPAGGVTVVETFPTGTSLDHRDVPDAWKVWPEMIEGARWRLDVAAFYVSDREGGRLERVLEAWEAAGARGVRVRVLADAGFYDTYPETLDRLAEMPGIQVRLLDYRDLEGGPLHAKYFVVDGREAYVGSQNFDWRALEHIHEVGLRIDVPGYAWALEEVFEADWERGVPLGNAGAEADSLRSLPETATLPPSLRLAATEARSARPAPPFDWVESSGDTARLWPAFSPSGDLPRGEDWDLPQILDLIDGARDSLQLTGLSYSPVSRDGSYWEVIDVALRGAANRGVTVRLLVSNWSTRAPKIDHLKSLALVPGVEVRIVSIPEAKEGFIPFARVTHAKYLTVDGEWCWLGTSNWEQSYFVTSRNVGVVLESPEITGILERDFKTLWESPYAEAVRAEREYTPPRIQDGD